MQTIIYSYDRQEINDYNDTYWYGNARQYSTRKMAELVRHNLDKNE
jgi:hypothetical protein